MGTSPNLEREIKEIKTSQNDIEVVFKNGSSFIASVAGEQARGLNKIDPIDRNIYRKFGELREA